MNMVLSLGGGFKHFLFSPLFGEMIQFDEHFLNGLKPTSKCIDSIEYMEATQFKDVFLSHTFRTIMRHPISPFKWREGFGIYCFENNTLDYIKFRLKMLLL